MKTKILGLGLVLAGLMLVGAGCYSSTSTSTTTKTSGTGNAVTMSNLTFSPSSLTVKKGTAVTWTNNDSVAHTVTGDNGGPASGQLGNGKTYSFTFDTVGTVAYHCSNHPSMTASVTVTP